MPINDVNDRPPETENPSDNNPNTKPPPPGCDEVRCAQEQPAPSLRLTRLTHKQWENASRDVLSLEARSGLSQQFQEDTLGASHFDRDARTLEVTPALWEDYREASETLAAQVTASPEAITALFPEAESMTGRDQTRAIIERVGRRAYRRPLTSEEIDAHLALYDEAPQHFAPDADPHQVGVELVMRALLQSPYFLYRAELTPVTGSEPARLGPYEIASKLAFGLWNTGPDDALLAAAAAGELGTREEVEAQALRMLDDPRAEGLVLDFYEQLLHMSTYDSLDRNPETYAAYDPGLGAAMRQEMELLLTDLVFDQDASMRDVLTTDATFVNDRLATFYGLEGDFGAEFERVELDAERRPGILTRSGFLAYTSGFEQPAPIQRGVFIIHHVTCSNVPDPPPNVIGDPFEGPTNRARWDNMTGTCGGSCHNSYINPAGFAFEHYDAIGQWRDVDGATAVDSSGSFDLDGESVSFAGADGLLGHIIESEQAHHCFAEHWFEYVYGRTPSDAEAPLVARIAHDSETDDLAIRDVLVQLVTSDAFLMRAAAADTP